MKGITVIIMLFVFVLNTFCQSNEVIRVGVKHEPPFVIAVEGEEYSGLSIDLWKSIARNQNVAYTFVEFSDHLGMIRSLDFNDIDICINPMYVDEIRLKMLDASLPYYVSYIGVATTLTSKTQVGTFLRNFFSFNHIRIVFFLIFIIFIFGTALWIVERKENRRQFRPGLPGLFDGLWWSAVTMTTVGYGDKAPKSRLGRLIAIIWMLTAIITISGFTGSIASSLTVQSLGRTIEDLDDLRNTEMIGSVMSSSSESFLRKNEIQAELLYLDARESLSALSSREIEVLVYDKTVLDYFIGELQLEKKVELLPVSFNQQYRSFLLPKNSPHLPWVNALLVRTINEASWQKLLLEYNLKME